ncbi:MAG: ABC transporter permease [Sarcina sp.]
MNGIKFVVREHMLNLDRMFKLSFYDFIAPLRDTYLGAIWIILNPLTQIGVYWIIFGLGIRGGRPVDGHPFLLWMLAGLIPWMYISMSISTGALSIYSKAGILKKMKFPSSIIPTYTILTQLMNIIPAILIMFIIFAFYDYKSNIYVIQIVYYLFAATMILIAISLLTSALVVAMRDINKVISIIMKFLFYFTPILWEPKNLPVTFQNILKLNPFRYIIIGFRDSLLYNRWFYEIPKEAIYFWGVTIFIFTIAIAIHLKFRDRFADLI